MDLDSDDMQIIVKLGAGDPSAIDKAAVAAEFPYGSVMIEPEFGGLDVLAESVATL